MFDNKFFGGLALVAGAVVLSEGIDDNSFITILVSIVIMMAGWQLIYSGDKNG